MKTIQAKMKEVFNKLKKRGGYISIEMVLIAGLTITMALFLTSEFTDKAVKVKETTLTSVDSSMDKYADYDRGAGGGSK